MSIGTGVIQPTTFVSTGAGCFPLLPRGSPLRPRDTLEGRVHSVHSSHGFARHGFQRTSNPEGFLILRPLVHQLLGAPITQHHLHQCALRLPLLDVSEGEFDGVEMKAIVIGLGRVMVTPGVSTGRLA